MIARLDCIPLASAPLSGESFTFELAKPRTGKCKPEAPEIVIAECAP